MQRIGSPLTAGGTARAWLAGAATLALAGGWMTPATAQAPKTDKKQESKPATTATTNSSAAKIPARVVLVYPTDAKDDASKALSDIITDVEQGRLTTSDRYRAVYFLSSLPTVKRALAEQTLSGKDVLPPFEGPKLKRLAELTGYDMALVSSVDDYQWNAAKKQVSLVMSAQLIDLSGEQPKIRSVGESLTSSDKAPKGATESTLAEQTARELTEKLMTSLLAPPKPATTPPTAVQKPNPTEKPEEKK